MRCRYTGSYNYGSYGNQHPPPMQSQYPALPHEAAISGPLHYAPYHRSSAQVSRGFGLLAQAPACPVPSLVRVTQLISASGCCGCGPCVTKGRMVSSVSLLPARGCPQRVPNRPSHPTSSRALGCEAVVSVSALSLTSLISRAVRHPFPGTATSDRTFHLLSYRHLPGADTRGVRSGWPRHPPGGLSGPHVRSFSGLPTPTISPGESS